MFSLALILALSGQISPVPPALAQATPPRQQVQEPTPVSLQAQIQALQTQLAALEKKNSELEGQQQVFRQQMAALEQQLAVLRARLERVAAPSSAAALEQANQALLANFARQCMTAVEVAQIDDPNATLATLNGQSCVKLLGREALPYTTAPNGAIQEAIILADEAVAGGYRLVMTRKDGRVFDYLNRQLRPRQ